MDNHHATGADEFRACRRYHQFSAVFTGPTDIDEFRFPSNTLNFSIGDGGAFNGVVDVRSKVLNDVPFLEQFNKN